MIYSTFSGAWRHDSLSWSPGPDVRIVHVDSNKSDRSIFFGILAANYLGFFNYNTVASVIIHIAILLPLAFTNAIFVDAERDGAQWLKEWKEEQSRYKIVANRLKTKNLVIWNPNKES